MTGGLVRSQLDTSIGQQQAQDWRAAIERRAGLVNARISEHLPHAHLVVYPNGIAVKVGGQPLPAHTAEQPAKRGAIYGFSKASRKRLLHLFASIDWSWKAATRLELTYPRDGWQANTTACLTASSSGNTVMSEGSADVVDGVQPGPQDWVLWKYHLARFHLELRRRWGKAYAGAIWKLEFQKRGAPHYHLVVFWNEQPPIGLLRHWLSHTWYKIVGSGDEKHLRAGTRLDPIYGTRGQAVGRLMAYLSKYLGKTWQTSSQATGRIWGCWDDIPSYQVGACSLDRDTFVQFTRRIRRWGKRKGRYLRKITANWRGFLILGDQELLGQLLRDLEVSVEADTS